MASSSTAALVVKNLAKKSFWIPDVGAGVNSIMTASTYPRLTFKDLEFDVCVIGGGITGVTTAYLLKQAGKKVALVEGNTLGASTTGTSTAKLSAQQGTCYTQITSKHNTKTARIYYEMQEAGIRTVEELVTTLNLKCDFERRAGATYATNEAELKMIHKEVDASRAVGAPAEFVDNLPDMPASVGVKGAVRFPNQAQFNSYKYCVELAKHIQGDGSSIFENSMITAVSNESPHEVKCGDIGSIRAGTVVLATHIPFLDRSGHFAVLKPSRSHCIAVTLTDNTKMVHDMYLSAGQPLRSLRSAADGNVLVVSGASYSQGEETDTDKRYEELEQWTKEHFPVAEVLTAWSAMDFFTGDHMPFIGYLHRGTETLLTATGFSKWGLANGVASALIFRDLIQKKHNDWVEAVDARRWDLMATGGNILQENLHTAKHFIGDKIKALVAPDVKTLKPGEGGLVKVDGKTVGAYCDHQGQYHFVNPICTHMGCHLLFNQGDKAWDCPCHGSRFTYNGEVLHGPATTCLAQIKDLSW